MLQTHQSSGPTELLGEDLSSMMMQSWQRCLTMLCPLHPANPDRSGDRISLKHMSQQAAMLIKQHWQPVQADQMLHQLEVMMNQIDLVRPPKGLGIYLNPTYHRVELFSFAVPPLVQIDDRFLIREWLWRMQINRPVYLLNLSEKSARLEEIRDGDWYAIEDHHFPRVFFDDHEYAKPVRSTSYAGQAHVKSYERDKTEMQQIRLCDYFHDTDAALNPYLMHGEPLILAGAERDISLFRQVAATGRNVIAQISGNFQHAHQEIFRDKVNHVMMEYRQSQLQHEVSAFFESWGAGLARCGIADCWEAIEKGQGRMLLVERGFREGLFRSPAGTFSSQKCSADAVWYPDVLDALMHLTLEKGGDVRLVENNSLGSAQRVALILRYPD